MYIFIYLSLSIENVERHKPSVHAENIKKLDFKKKEDLTLAIASLNDFVIKMRIAKYRIKFRLTHYICYM